MTCETCALAFVKRASDETAFDELTVRAVTCCDNKVAVLFRPALRSEKEFPWFARSPNNAFLIAVQMTEPDLAKQRGLPPSGQLHQRAGIRILDLKRGAIPPLSSLAEWLLVYLPVSYLQALRTRSTGDTMRLRDPLGRADRELHALASTLRPIACDNCKGSQMLLDNLVATFARLAVERYKSHGSAPAEKCQDFEKRPSSA